MLKDNKLAVSLSVMMVVGVAAYVFIAEPPKRGEQPYATSGEEYRTEANDQASMGKVPAENVLDTKPAESESLDAEMVSKEKELSSEERKVLAAEKKAEIDILIREYDLVLSDTEKRAEIQAKVNALMDEYNDLILPIAVAEMKAGQ